MIQGCTNQIRASEFSSLTEQRRNGAAMLWTSLCYASSVQFSEPDSPKVIVKFTTSRLNFFIFAVVLSTEGLLFFWAYEEENEQLIFDKCRKTLINSHKNW